MVLKSCSLLNVTFLWRSDQYDGLFAEEMEGKLPNPVFTLESDGIIKLII